MSESTTETTGTPPTTDASTTGTPAANSAPATGTPPVTDSAAPVVPVELQFKEGIPDVIKNFAKTNKYNQEQLDSTLQFFGDFTQKQQQAIAQAQFEKGKAHVESWGQEAQYKLTLAKNALAVIDKQGNLATMLKTSGAANDPAVLDALVNLGTMLKEGGFIKGANTPPPGKKSLAEKMYPTQGAQAQ